MNNKILSGKRNSAIILATLLVLGTLATISPSFMTNASAQAESYYGMDNNSYKSQYGQDKYKSKDSSNVLVKKINFNNINVNVNGLELSVLPTALSGLLTGGEADNEGQYGASSYGSGSGGQSGYDNNSFKFVCVNNNNNTVVVAEEEPPVPSDTSACTDCFSVLTQTQIGSLLAIVGATSIEVYCELLLVTPNSPAESLSVRDALNNIPGIFQSQFLDILECLIDEGVIGPIPPPQP